MIGALIASTLFLVSYVTYHALIHGVTKYQKVGLIRTVYFTILGTHTPLAILIVPFIIAAVRYAMKGEFVKHTRITKWLLPVWMYVSVTGVIIYVMLYIL
jgi:putative membrane protein